MARRNGGWVGFWALGLVAVSGCRAEAERKEAPPDPGAMAGAASEKAALAPAATAPFPVLSDPDLAAHAALRVLHTAEDAEVERLRGFGVDIEKVSGRKHHQFAVPSLFLVDTAGRVRWAHADADYKTRPRTPQILAAIDEAKLWAFCA